MASLLERVFSGPPSGWLEINSTDDEALLLLCRFLAFCLRQRIGLTEAHHLPFPGPDLLEHCDRGRIRGCLRSLLDFATVLGDPSALTV